jgi:hypothetical protein
MTTVDFVVSDRFLRDWIAYNICGLTRRPLDRALRQADFIFVARDSELRQNKRWDG